MAQQTNAALGGIVGLFNELDSRLNRMVESQEKLLKAISEQKPTVNMPARPRGFSVELLNDEDGVRRMRVTADNTTH